MVIAGLRPSIRPYLFEILELYFKLALFEVAELPRLERNGPTKRQPVWPEQESAARIAALGCRRKKPPGVAYRTPALKFMTDVVARFQRTNNGLRCL
jgi:hypothetical protein